MIYTHFAAALVGIALSAIATWNVQAWRYDAQIADIKTAHAQANALAAEEATRIYTAMTDQYQGALNDARKREAGLRRDAAAARTESDGLRQQAADAARRIADAPPAAVADYALATGELLVDCSRRYQELAAIADGHSADVRTLVEAWPVTGAADARHQD